MAPLAHRCLFSAGWLWAVFVGSAAVAAGSGNWTPFDSQNAAFQWRPVIDGWRWVDQEPDRDAGAARWLGLSPNQTDTLALVYELVLEGSHLTGRLGVSEVQLEKVDGTWSGRFGAQFISEAKVVNGDSDIVTVEVTSVGTSGPSLAEPGRHDGTAPGAQRPTFNTSPRMASGGPGRTLVPAPRNALTGRRRFPLVTIEDGSTVARMTGGRSQIDGAVTLSADGTRLRLSTRDELVSTDGALYRGREQPRYDVAHECEAYGALTPSQLVETDPVLYVLLYRVALELEAFFPN